MEERENVWFNRMLLSLLAIIWIIPYFLINDLYLNLTPRIYGAIFIILSFGFVIFCMVMMLKNLKKIYALEWTDTLDWFLNNKYLKLLFYNVIIVLAIISIVLIFNTFSAAETQEEYNTAKLFSIITIGIFILVGLSGYILNFKVIPKYFNSEIKFFDIDLKKANSILIKYLKKSGYDIETKYYPKQTLMLESHYIKIKNHHISINLQSMDDGTRIAVNYRKSENKIKNQMKKIIEGALS